MAGYGAFYLTIRLQYDILTTSTTQQDRTIDKIEAVIAVLGCSEEDAEKFLNDECGSYADVGGRKVWVSGALINRIIKAGEQQ